MITRIGKYTVEKEVGHGGFGIVYLAIDPDVGQPVAIKRLRAEGDPDLLKRFQLEIRTTASLRHKNIVTIHASGQEAGDPYLVMEFLEGQTLKQVIQEQRPLTLLEKVRIMTQVADGLAYAHSKGVVHRDVKPENIMLLPDDGVKIMDFGIALGPERNTKVTQTGGLIGTPLYFAPEQIEGYKANEQTDIFSYGNVYYELLTGVHPFVEYKNDWKSLQLAILSYEPRSLAELAPGCPESLETLVHRTLAKQPELRYQKFDEIQLDSEAILVDLKHEGAAAILRDIPGLVQSGNLETAESKIRQAYQLEPGNREVRRWREEINLLIRESQNQRRVTELQAEAERLMSQKRYAEAVQSLELASKLDTKNVVIADSLQRAKEFLGDYVKANRLVSEARLHQQQGLLTEANRCLGQALSINPEHTEAKRLSERIQKDLRQREIEQLRQQAIRTAREHLAALRFAEALAVLNGIEQALPGAEGVAELRQMILEKQQEEASRARAEQFNLALEKTREALQAGDIERTRLLINELAANFASEPGAAAIVRELQQRLDTLIQAREIARYQQNTRDLLKQEQFQEALDLLAEARHKFPDDSGLARLHDLAQDAYRAHERSEAIAALVKEAAAKRDAGDLEGARDAIVTGRKVLGDDAVLMQLARQLEMEIEQQRYGAGLNKLLAGGRALLAANRYSEAVSLLSGATEFAGELEIRALLDSARAAVAIEQERQFVEEILAASTDLQSGGNGNEALDTVKRGLERYPHNATLRQRALRLRDWVEMERRRSVIAQHRAAIRAAIDAGQWKQAEALLLQARVEFPGDNAFDDLSEQVQAGLYEEGWWELAARVNQNRADHNLVQAQANLEERQTRTIYAKDPRWQALNQEIANAIQIKDSEALRQQEITRKAGEIRECLQQNNPAQAALLLAAARARYPGESLWSDLQPELDKQQEILRRQTELASAEAAIVQALNRDGIQQARAALRAAREKFPGEPQWAALEAKIQAREDLLKRQAEIETAARNIQQCLHREAPAATLQLSFPANANLLLGRCREDVLQAQKELDGARARHPGESLWGTLRAEVDARWAFLDAEAEIAERLSQEMERGEFLEAETQLTAARASYPDEPFWNLFAAELVRRRQQALEQASVAEFEGRVREALKQQDTQTARAGLDTARRKHPEAPLWNGLQAEIESLESLLLHQAEVDKRRQSRDRLLAIEQQAAAEPRQRKRGALDREAQRLAEACPNDPEIAAAANRIHALAAVKTSQPVKPLPRTLIGAGIGTAVAAVVLVLVIRNHTGDRKRPSEPSAPTPDALIAVEIRTDPPGASVHVADRSCVTPNCRLDLAPGDYQVLAELKGYDPRQQSIRFDSSNRLVSMTLNPVAVAPQPSEPIPATVTTGTLVVQAGVPDVAVYVDNIRQRTRTNQSGSATLSLEARDHEVRVERDGYEKPPAQRATIPAGGQRTLRFQMKQELARVERVVPAAPPTVTAPVQPPAPPTVSPKGNTQTSPAPPAVKKGPTPEEIEESDWQKVDRADLAQLRAFVVQYPGGKHQKDVQNAIDRLDERAWSRNNQKDDANALRGYLTDFPKGLHASEADDLLWKAIDPNNIEQVRKFAETYPNSAHLRAAQRMLDAFDTKQELFRKLVRETIQRFNQAIKKKPIKESDLKGIWTGKDRSEKIILDNLNHAAEQISFTIQEPPNIQSDTTAIVRCTMTMALTNKVDTVVVELREAGGAWMIERIRTPQ